MKKLGLLNPPEKKKAPRKEKPKPEAKKPREILGIDATKIYTTKQGWLYLVIVKDWYTKEILGWRLSKVNTARVWKEALEEALEDIQEDKSLFLVSDHGSQPTSKTFRDFCRDKEITQIFTTFNNPKGNADTERFSRTLKEDLIWPNEFEGYCDLYEGLSRYMDFYNHRYCHTSINYMSPREFYLNVCSNSTKVLLKNVS